MGNNKFDKDAYLRAAVVFREKVEVEGLLDETLTRAVSLLGDAAVGLVAMTRGIAGDKGPVLTASIAETSVQIRGGNRNILIAPAKGLGNDSRLHKPRYQMCAQALVFCHLSGQDESSLLSSFRVYADGQCTDGEMVWSVDDGVDGFQPYLSHLIQASIFECEPFWPDLGDLPDFMQRIPILLEEVQEDPLKRTCVGFECSLQKKG